MSSCSRSRVLALALLVVLGCGCSGFARDEPSCISPVVSNVLLVETELFFASGVYLGGGMVLTNWHVAVSSASIDLDVPGGLPEADELRLFEVDGEEEALVAEHYCFDEMGGYFRASSRDESCTPVNLASSHRYRSRGVWTERGAELLYADAELDLAVVRLEQTTEALDDLPRVAIADHAPEKGAAVVLAGYPGGLYAEEECEVTSNGVRPIEDTSEAFPSDLVVESFEIDCQRAGQGSSGSPVFDRVTGELLGVLWTVGREGRAVVSAASSWRGRAMEREAASGSVVLGELLADHAVCL